jgi:hypothetical protein
MQSVSATCMIMWYYAVPLSHFNEIDANWAVIRCVMICTYWYGYILRKEGTHCILSYTSHSVSHVLHQRTASHSSYILHLTSYALRLTPYVLRLTSYILHLTPYVLRLTSYILHLTSYVLHLTSYTLHLTPYILHLTPYVLRLTPYALCLTSYVLHLTSYILHLTSYILYHIVSYSVPCDMYTSCV